MNVVDKGTPTDLETLLLRFAEMEKEIAFLKSELARKDKIIAGLQQRLFGSSSEKLEPKQLQLEMDELLLGTVAKRRWTGANATCPAGVSEANQSRNLFRNQAAKYPHRRRKNQAPQKNAAPRLTVSRKTS